MNCTSIVRHLITIGGAFLMAKFTAIDRLNAVKQYLKSNESQLAFVESIGIDESLLRTWIQQYEYQEIKLFKKAIQAIRCSIN